MTAEGTSGRCCFCRRVWLNIETWCHILKTHWLGSWKHCLIVFCSLYLLLGVWRLLGWLSVAESECMCVFSKHATRQEMTCPIVVGLDTVWFTSPHISLAIHRLHLSPSEISPLQHRINREQSSITSGSGPTSQWACYPSVLQVE